MMMINDEKRVTEIADMVGAEVFDHNEFACVFDSKEKLIAFEQEVLKRTGLEVLELREALEISYDYLRSHWDMESVPLNRVNEALTNSEASAKRIKAGIESDVLEEAELVSYEYFMHGMDARDVAAELNRLAEERSAIAKGEE